MEHVGLVTGQWDVVVDIICKFIFILFIRMILISSALYKDLYTVN